MNIKLKFEEDKDNKVSYIRTEVHEIGKSYESLSVFYPDDIEQSLKLIEMSLFSCLREINK